MAKITLTKPKLFSDELDRLLADDTTDSVSKDTPPTELPVSKDTTIAENAVSKDTISDDKGVSKDTQTAVNAVSKDTDRVAYQREFRKKRYKTVSLDTSE